MSDTIADAASRWRGARLTLAAMAILLVPATIVGVRHYNAIVAQQEQATAAWSQVVSSYQRRRDLVPLLVETVSGYLKHEQMTLVAVTRVRRLGAAILQRALDDLASANVETPPVGAASAVRLASREQLIAAERRLGGALQGLIAVVENYPELRSAENFSMLQSQLEGTENRINIARLRFNEATETYNRAIRRIPGNFVAAVTGFESQPYFAAEAGVEQPAGVDFQ